MRYLSVCSGIEAATVAWHPLGFTAHAYAEIDAFPAAVLRHHYPHTPNYGDMTTFKDWPDATVDVLVGGTPCQSFSVAGLRKGLADPRGNLALTYLALADRYRPRWVVWENVPGVLSSNDGRDFGAFVGGLAQLGYLGGYRVLDAQYFGLAQRRARVFVVGHLGDWRRAAAVLFERESLSGHPAPCREAGERVAPTLAGCSNGGGPNGPGRDVDTCDSLIAHALRADGFDASEDGTGRGTPIVPIGYSETGQGWWTEGLAGLRAEPGGTPENIIAFSVKDHGADAGELAPTLRAGTHDKSHANGGVMPAVAFHNNLARDGGKGEHERTGPLKAVGTKDPTLMMRGMQVRRLTPKECERLQGFPDDYTLISYRGKPAKDGPRYKALGNSMAVPVMRWIGERMRAVESITTVG